MRKAALVVSAVLGMAMLAATPAAGDDAYLIAYMNGANERPGPGDPDAFGRATITIDDETNRLCLTLWWRNVDGTPSGLHIHLAPPTSPGPIVVPFQTPPAGTSSTYQCVTVENEALLDNIAANPGQYYINLHSTPLYAGGAIRGQLQRL
jgi:hypothetical protein